MCDKQSQAYEASRLSRRVSIVYWLYLGWVVVPVMPVFVLAGVLLAAFSRKGATPAEASHYLFQMRTVWIWLVAAFVGVSLRVFGVGWLLLAGLWVWTAVRSIWGLRLVRAGRAQPRPTSYFWG